MISLGKLGRARGLKGGIVFWPHNPASDALDVGMTVTVGDLSLRIRKIRPMNDGLELEFDGYDSPEAVKALTHLELSVERDQLPELEEDEFYVEDLVGLQARDEAGNVLGEVSRTEDAPASTLLEVRTKDMKKVLVPAIEEFLREVVPGSHVVLRPIPGMFDDTDE